MLFRLARLFAQEKQVVKAANSAGNKAVSTYVNGELISRSALILKKHQDIQAFVLKTIKGYFRTTYRDGLNAESVLINHGLDSLDSIEICMKIEEELGYRIAAESLPGFTKVKHYINYIKATQQYKATFNEAPLP